MTNRRINQRPTVIYRRRAPMSLDWSLLGWMIRWVAEYELARKKDVQWTRAQQWRSWEFQRLRMWRRVHGRLEKGGMWKEYRRVLNDAGTTGSVHN